MSDFPSREFDRWKQDVDEDEQEPGERDPDDDIDDDWPDLWIEEREDIIGELD